MKTFGLWLKMAGLCLMFALAFPACSDDDEEKEEPGGVENVKQDGVKMGTRLRLNTATRFRERSTRSLMCIRSSSTAIHVPVLLVP